MKTSKAKIYQFTVVFEREQDPEFKGYYNASVPALPGCFSYGATKDEALKNVKEAIEVYLESLMAEGEPIPSDQEPLVEKIKVAV